MSFPVPDQLREYGETSFGRKKWEKPQFGRMRNQWNRAGAGSNPEPSLRGLILLNV
jgi:hypothetical protein